MNTRDRPNAKLRRVIRKTRAAFDVTHTNFVLFGGVFAVPLGCSFTVLGPRDPMVAIDTSTLAGV